MSCHTGDGFVTALGRLGRLRQLPPALAGGVTVPGSPAGSAPRWAFLLLAALAGLLTLQLLSPPLFYSGAWDLLEESLRAPLGGGEGSGRGLPSGPLPARISPAHFHLHHSLPQWCGLMCLVGSGRKHGMLLPILWGSPPPLSQSFNLKVRPRAQSTLTETSYLPSHLQHHPSTPRRGSYLLSVGEGNCLYCLGHSPLLWIVSPSQ